MNIPQGVEVASRVSAHYDDVTETLFIVLSWLRHTHVISWEMYSQIVIVALSA